MGHRGIYKVIADGQRAAYYTHWGVASPFSIFRRLLCALELKEGGHRDKSILDILANLGEDGEYATDDDSHRMFERLSLRERRIYDGSFHKPHSGLEMRVTLNFDTNTAFLEHNPYYCHYKYVGNYFIPLDQGVQNIRAVLAYAKRTGMEDVMEVAAAFHRHTGMEAVYDRAARFYEQEPPTFVANPQKLKDEIHLER